MGKARLKNLVGCSGKRPQVSNKSELIQLREYLKKRIATATMAAVALNIYRPNLCRHKRELQKNNALIVVGKGICAITKHRAEFLSCDLKGRVKA